MQFEREKRRQAGSEKNLDVDHLGNVFSHKS